MTPGSSATYDSFNGIDLSPTSDPPVLRHVSAGRRTGHKGLGTRPGPMSSGGASTESGRPSGWDHRYLGVRAGGAGWPGPNDPCDSNHPRIAGVRGCIDPLKVSWSPDGIRVDNRPSVPEI